MVGLGIVSGPELMHFVDGLLGFVDIVIEFWAGVLVFNGTISNSDRLGIFVTWLGVDSGDPGASVSFIHSKLVSKLSSADESRSLSAMLVALVLGVGLRGIVSELDDGSDFFSLLLDSIDEQGSFLVEPIACFCTALFSNK